MSNESTSPTIANPLPARLAAALERMQTLTVHLTLINARALAAGKPAMCKLIIGDDEIATFEAQPFAADLITLTQALDSETAALFRGEEP